MSTQTLATLALTPGRAKSYCPNGVFIAAAIHAGYRVERASHDSPNAFFNMHSIDLKRKRPPR